ncbi:MAG: HypC/HybG/HupF family hydrogenase formation chaperone [Leptospirales bacterium]|nr:HypC/HybG/HupF family hydrogenase formation chaperone [Leptospirales bacterium]
MCLAVPMEIIKIEGDIAIAAAKGVETPVNIMLADDIKIGDKVLIHAGFIIEKLDPEAAKEIEETFEEYLRAAYTEDELLPYS